MTVLQEILKWSKERPLWQRDALRRLVRSGELTDDDIAELTTICKGDHGLADKVDAEPLAPHHVPEHKAATSAVSLESICHHKGVNALAENQTLRFDRGLTIVYGDNGAGKTGYIRILKQACRARGREEILGNVGSDTAPPRPEVTVNYKVGEEQASRQWTGGDADEFVSRVSIFDTQSAAVYLNDKTDVAFLPFGLDLFDKLVRACRLVSKRLEAEQRGLNTKAVSLIAPQIPAGTAAAKLTANITSLTKPEAVHAVTRLTSAESERLAFLEKALQDLQANDPAKLRAQLELRASRAHALAEHLRGVEATLSNVAIGAVFKVRSSGRAKGEEARQLQAKTFPSGLLAGTGGDQWKSMWDASRLFSEQQAYPAQAFPFTGNGAKCALCQQNLGHEAEHRLKQFEEFVASTTERELKKLREDFGRKRKAFADLKTSTEAIEETLRELRLDDEERTSTISTAIAHNERRRAAVVAALTGDSDLPADFPALAVGSTHASAVAVELDARIKTLRNTEAAVTTKKLADEAHELRARVTLGKYEKIILDEIENKKKYAAYSQCLAETKPTAITQKSSEVTRSVVSAGLKKSFKDELQKLEFKHVEVELKEQGGAEGVFYHKLVLTRNPGIEVPRVVSEGEQRCISIAAFFAELSTAADPSAIVFDDPVSSLDFQWRIAVARRLVEESTRRQVIVFTHDVVFLLELKQISEKWRATQHDQHIRRQDRGAGVCSSELPWVAMEVKAKIGHLKNQQVEAEKLSKAGNQDAYEYAAKYLYGLLREAWERAVEEVLLNGSVERYRPTIQTQRLAKVSDITEDDGQTVDIAMTKCSRWLPGHDQAPAARAPVPSAAELKADIEALDTWVRAVRQRRQKAAKGSA